MPCHHHRPQRSQEQRDNRKHAGFYENGKADWHANAQNVTDALPVRFHPVCQYMEGPEGLAVVQVHQQGDGRRSVRQGGGPAATHAPHGRQAELSVDENVVQGQVDQGAEHRKCHDHPGVPEPVRQASQGVHQQHGGNAPGEGIQVALGYACGGGLHLQHRQHRLYVGQQQHHHYGAGQGDVQPLPGSRHDLAGGAGTVVAGNDRLQRAEHAHEKQEQRHPQAAADADTGQVFGTGVAGHHGIDDTIGHLGQLGNQDGAAQNSQGFPFSKGAADQRLPGFW